MPLTAQRFVEGKLTDCTIAEFDAWLQVLAKRRSALSDMESVTIGLAAEAYAALRVALEAETARARQAETTAYDARQHTNVVMRKLAATELAAQQDLATMRAETERLTSELAGLSLDYGNLLRDHDRLEGERDALAAPLTPVVSDVLRERERQDAKWGGPAHDDTHSIWEWWSFIKQRMVARAYPGGKADERRDMVEIAALAVAAVESLDRRSAAPTGEDGPR